MLLRNRLWMGWVLAASLLCGACSKTETPEAQVRAAIAQAEAAAGKKDIATLRDLISAKYADAQGQDKRAVEGVLRVYFLRNQSIHLFTRTQSVSLPQPNHALVVVYVGMAAQPVKSADELERLRADLYRFEISFARENDAWRVVRAEWRAVEFTDFVH